MSIKSDRKCKLSVFTYLLTIVAYSINARNPTSEYFHIREYLYICTILSLIFLHMYGYVTNVFNMHASVSIAGAQQRSGDRNVVVS